MDTFEKLDLNTSKSEVRMTKSDYSQVVFIGIQEQYDLSVGGVECTFELPELFSASRDDWVGIFPVGWSTTSDKICFLKVSLPDNYQNGKACTCRLIFSGLALPADESDFYQFCYVTGLGLVRGMSVPWQTRHSNSDDFVTEEDTDDDVMVIRRRTDTLEDETRRLREDNALLGRKIDATKADFDSLTAKYADKMLQLKSAAQTTEQMKLQLEDKDRQLDAMETVSKDMTVLQAALDEQIKALTQERDVLTGRVEEGVTQVRGLQERLTHLLNDKDALEGQLKQASDEKHLLKEQLASVEEKLKQASLEMLKLKTQAETVDRMAQEQLQQRDTAIDALQVALNELKTQYSEAVEKAESSRNQVEAMSKSKAMMEEERSRLQQCLQAAESNIEEMRRQLEAEQEQVMRAEAQRRDVEGKLEAVFVEYEAHAAKVEDMAGTLVHKDELIAAQQQEMQQLKDAFARLEAEVAERHEGPIAALRQAYEQLKERLNKEQDKNKTLSADIGKLKKKVSSHAEKEASLQREVDDLKTRLQMSEQVYTDAMVECKTVKDKLRRARQQSGGGADGAAGDEEAGSSVCVEMQQLRADNARLQASLTALQEHYREEMDKLQAKYDKQHADWLRQLQQCEAKRLAVSGGDEDEADGPSTNRVSDPMGDSAANGRAFLQAPLTPLPPPLTPVRLLPPAIAPAGDQGACAPPPALAAPPASNEEDKFEDAVGEPQPAAPLTERCQYCSQVFTGSDATALYLVHMDEHVANMCPVCNSIFEPNTTSDVRQQHVNSHFTD